MKGKAASGYIFKAVLAAFAVSAPTAAPAGDWPMFRGGAARTGYAAEQACPPLTKAWESDGHGGIISSPVVLDNSVYFGSRDKKLYAFDARTGAPLWQYETGGWIDASPAVSSGAVYAASMDGYLYAFGRFNGSVLWKAALGASSVSSPLLFDGRLWVGAGSPENKLKVFDAVTGALLADYAAGQPVDSAPSADGQRVYFGANNGKLYAFDKDALSAPAWLYQTMGGRYGMNAVPVSTGMVYALPGFDENKPLVFRAADGVLLNPLNDPFETAVPLGDGTIPWAQVGSPVVSPDRLYFTGGFSANKLYSFSAQPAGDALAPAWAAALGASSGVGLLSSPAMADDIVYTGTVEGGLAAFTPAGGPVPLVADVAFSSPVYSSPAISNGMVFVGTSGGKFVAYRAARTAAFTSPAPGGILNGIVQVKGYLSNPDLAGYTLDYSTGGVPAVWRDVGPSSATAYPVDNAELGGWDTSGLPNGDYTLRLTVLENSAPANDNTALLKVRVNAAPAAPSGLTAADVPADNGNRLKLDWTSSVTAGLAAYRIYRGSGGSLAMLASVGAGTLTYTDNTAVTGSTFTYSVRAFDGYVESSDSNLANACAANNTGDLIPPSRIADLSAAPGGDGGVAAIVWTAPGNDGTLGSASHYVIKYTSATGYDWSAFDTATDLAVTTRAAEGPYGTREADEIRGLAGGVTYYFAIKAADFVPNYSPLSDIATTWAAADPVPPQAPSELTAADTLADGGGSVTLGWSLSPDDGAGAGDVYGYRIYRRVQGGSYVSTAPYAAVPAGVKSYADAAATENIRFYYSVAAFDSTNNSGLSNEASAVSANNWRFFDASRGVSVRLKDGARVDVPESAASQNDNIMVTRLDPDTYQPLFRTSGALPGNPTGIVYEIKFENPATRLLKPALVSLPYTEAEVAGMDLESLRMYTLVGGKWTIVNTSKPDAAARKVTAEVNHFSLYTVMEYVPSGALFEGNEVYTYPNPARGSALTFKFRVSDKAFVKIDVYDVAGQKVARLEKAGCPAGVTSEITWNIGRIASGVYQYRLEAAGASGTRSVVKRLAIIH